MCEPRVRYDLESGRGSLRLKARWSTVGAYPSGGLSAVAMDAQHDSDENDNMLLLKSL